MAFRWALAGYGDLPRRRLVEALGPPEQELVRVWGRDPQRAQAFALEMGIPEVAASPEELSRGVDAVYIATPVVSHVPLARLALGQGRAVLVEKPLAAGLGDGAELLDSARRAGAPAAMAYYRRLAPAPQRLKEILDGGELGTLLAIEGSWRGVFAPGPEDPMLWRTRLKDAGAGVLADAGSHRLDLLCWLLGSPSHLTARLGDPFPGGAERRADLRLTWLLGGDEAQQREVSARLHLAWMAPGDEEAEDRLSFVFERGRLELPDLDKGRLVWQGEESWEEHLPPAANPHRALVEDFRRALLDGRAPVCPLEDGLLVDRIIESAQASSDRDGLQVQVPADFPSR